MIAIRIDKSQLDDVKRIAYGIKNGHIKVMTRAVNKTMTGIRTDAVQEIYNVLNLTKKRIRRDFAIRKMTWSSPEARIVSIGKPVSLTTFSGTREVKSGVSVKVKRTGSRKIIKRAFIEATKGGSKQAFWREYQGPRTMFRPGVSYARLPRKYRYPIRRLTGPRIQDIYDDPMVMNKVMKKADDRLSKNLDRETAYLLSRT